MYESEERRIGAAGAFSVDGEARYYRRGVDDDGAVPDHRECALLGSTDSGIVDYKGNHRTLSKIVDSYLILCAEKAIRNRLEADALKSGGLKYFKMDTRKPRVYILRLVRGQNNLEKIILKKR
jgi:hypothetical protein